MVQLRDWVETHIPRSSLMLQKQSRALLNGSSFKQGYTLSVVWYFC